MDNPMLLELSATLILNLDDLGFYVGTYHLEADPVRDVIEARTFIVKLWFVMFQATVYGS